MDPGTQPKRSSLNQHRSRQHSFAGVANGVLFIESWDPLATANGSVRLVGLRHGENDWLAFRTCDAEDNRLTSKSTRP
jgi:hypothetical protein